MASSVTMAVTHLLLYMFSLRLEDNSCPQELSLLLVFTDIGATALFQVLLVEGKNHRKEEN